MDLDTGESDERFALNAGWIGTAQVVGHTAYVIGADRGGGFLGSFAPNEPTSLHVILSGLRAALPPVLHDGAVDIIDKDYAGQHARLFRIPRTSTDQFELVVDLGLRTPNAATWADQAVWVSSLADNSSTLTRIGSTGEQVEYSVPYAPVQLATAGDRLIIGAYRDGGVMQVLAQPLD